MSRNYDEDHTAELRIINVIDLTSQKNDGHYRHVSLMDVGELRGHLCLIGGLKHCTSFTFNKENAQKMVDFLQNDIIDA